MIDPRSIRDAQAALRLYQKATNKSAADVLNRFTRNVLMWSIRFTPKTPLPKIRKEADPVKGEKRWLWKLAARDGWKKGDGIGKEVERRYNRRRESNGFIAAGFVKALRVFGGRSRAGKFREGGAAAGGTGRRARDSRLVAEFTNVADGAGEVAYGPLNKAMNHISEDMKNHAYERMQKDANKYSAR
jgi:hypothetical protein